MTSCWLFGHACHGLAGTYVLKPLDPPSFPKNPSGGMVYWGHGNFSAYGGNAASYGGGNPDIDNVTCMGAITTVWVWKRDQLPDPGNPGQFYDDPLDNPPAFVISREYCSAWATATSLGDRYVLSDNGLGFAAETYDDGEQEWSLSEGTLYTKRAGGQEITLTCTPFASALVSIPNPPLMSVDATVQYSSSIIVPKVSLVGTTRFYDPQLVAFLTGQQVTGSVTGNGPLQILKYSWSLDDEAGVGMFKSYTHTNASGKKNIHTKTDRAQALFAFYTVKAAEITAKCELTLAAAPQGVKYAGGLPAFTAESWPVDSVRPELADASVDVMDGKVNLLPTSFKFGEDQTTGAQHGQDWNNVTFTEFGPFSTSGSGCFVQLITANRNMYRTAAQGYATHFTYQKTAVLDTGYPYPFQSGAWNLPGSGRFVDNPEQDYVWIPVGGGGGNWYEASANDSFKVWAMFKPPPSVQGQYTAWIPIASYTWAWHGTVKKQGGLWGLTASGGGAVLSPNEEGEHPEWNGWSPSPFTLYPAPPGG